MIARGAHIEIRDAVWRVQDVKPTSTGHDAWFCVGVSEIVRDQEAVFLEEVEGTVRVLDPRETRFVRDTSSHHRAGLLWLETLLREVPPPDDALCVGHRAAMDVLDFQLEPAWMALRQPRQRILIADAVGLGKTLEAGILLSELIRRGRARRILVCTTRAMLTQFQKELWGRFSIPLVRLDSVGLQRIRGEIPTHHNPFRVHDRVIVSIDTLKQNNWFRTHVEEAPWDVVVIDEAHNIALRGGSASLRARLARTLSRRCDSLILLSATPHDGRAESFASLMNMLDPTAIADPAAYTPDDIRGLFVRRFRTDVADQLASRIPERTVLSAHAPASPAEETAYALLASLHLPALDRGAAHGILTRVGLEKALFSSPAACLDQLRAPLKRDSVRKLLPRPLRDTLPSLPVPDALQRAADALDTPDLHPALAADLRQLAALARAVAHITPEHFSRFHNLLRVLSDTGWTPRNKRDRLVLFTERRETLAFLLEHLPAALGCHPRHFATLHGSLPDVDQQRIVEDFGKEGSDVRVLIATDAASEGLNLHYQCHRLVHFDVPWSLMVFQQRNGRIDRYGQERSPQIVYLLTDSSHPVIRGDARILELLIRKDEQARANIGDPSAFLGVWDVEEEERMTALAMQQGDVDAFDAAMDQALMDPFAHLLADAGESAGPAPVVEPLSLFRSDFDLLSTGLELLRADGPIDADIREKDRLIELRCPDDLRRRLDRLPAEVRPDDNVLVLTASSDRMMRALDEARREESAWPRHHYLWGNHPIFAWLADRVRGRFGRHSAPVLALPGLPSREHRIIVSGLLSNRRGQPLVHRWYTACFTGARLTDLEPFEQTVDTLRLGRDVLPNSARPVDIDHLHAILPAAIDAVDTQLRQDRDAHRARLRPLLQEELDRLAHLQQRRLQAVAERFAGRDHARASQERERLEREARTLFAAHENWIREAMTPADHPFLQVVAGLVGEG